MYLMFNMLGLVCGVLHAGVEAQGIKRVLQLYLAQTRLNWVCGRLVMLLWCGVEESFFT